MKLYDSFLSSNHLEAGVGTGFYLERCRFPKGPLRLAILDLNVNCLEVSSRRLRRYRPETIRANLLAPIPYNGSTFDSIGLSYILHCLPGNLRTKDCAFDHLKALLHPGGVIFGATLLAEGLEVEPLARMVMRFYNGRRVLCNLEDSLVDLRAALRGRFSEFDIETVGPVALFWAR